MVPWLRPLQWLPLTQSKSHSSQWPARPCPLCPPAPPPPHVFTDLIPPLCPLPLLQPHWPPLTALGSFIRQAHSTLPPLLFAPSGTSSFKSIQGSLAPIFRLYLKHHLLTPLFNPATLTSPAHSDLFSSTALHVSHLLHNLLVYLFSVSPSGM